MNEQTQIIKSLTKEEQELLCFFRPVGYHTRLQQYWEYPQGFSERTTAPKSNISLSTTKTFRRYLRYLIRTFQPEKLLSSNDLWLHLEGNGRFSVRLGENGEEITALSEADNYVFQYLCFLHIRRFWNGLRKHCRFPAVKLPVMVQDFSDRLEENMDYDALLQMFFDVSTQVVILS